MADLEITSSGPCIESYASQFLKYSLSTPLPPLGDFCLRWFRSLLGKKTASGSTFTIQSCRSTAPLLLIAIQALMKVSEFSGLVCAPVAACAPPTAQVATSPASNFWPLVYGGKPCRPSLVMTTGLSVTTACSLHPKMPPCFSFISWMSFSSHQWAGPVVCMTQKQKSDGKSGIGVVVVATAVVSTGEAAAGATAELAAGDAGEPASAAPSSR
mmetsp:Transcript_103825/g.293598  ORF Transcript_103825/g.293598 Transcript_103825/m.293598 type:complete len:213 (-) Transcript_103825:279-917(-)